MEMPKKAASIFSIVLLVMFGAGCGEKEKPQKISLQEKLPAQIENEVEDILIFGVAMGENPQGAHRRYTPFTDYLSKKIGVELKLVQRRTYFEFSELFQAGDIDFGMIATGLYIHLKKETDLGILALITKDGNPYFQACIVVHGDSPIMRFDELRGKTFAFVDQESISGFHYPSRLVAKRKADTNTFFSRIVFTGSHDKSITAVLNGDVDGAGVSSSVLSEVLQRHSHIKKKIRIIHESPPLFRGPLVVKKDLPVELKKEIERIIFNMYRDDEGREILKVMNVDGFIRGYDSVFDSAREIIGIGAKKLGHEL